MSLLRKNEDLKNCQVIRKLGNYESYYDYEGINGAIYVTSALLVNLKNGVIDISLLKKACAHWCKRNPLLQAEVFRAESSKYDKYFVKFSDEEKFNRFENVELTETEDELKWKEVVEREAVHLFDLKKDPLWRLKVLKLINKTNCEYNYAFIFTFQHAFCDGRSVYTFGVQLLNILGALLENRNCAEMESVKLSEFCAEELIAQKTFTFGEHTSEHVPDNLNRRPECFGDKINGQLTGKMEYFTVANDKLKKLLAKMKQTSQLTKLTGVLTALFALTQKNLQEKYNCPQESKRFQFWQLVCIREKLGIDNSYNGVYSCVLDQCCEFDLNLSNIWQFAEKASIGLHSEIKKNVDIKRFESTEQLWQSTLTEQFDESQLNGIFSNIGIVNNTESDVIKVVENSIRLSGIYSRIGSTIYNAISTINGKLCWAITYNEKYIAQKFILEMIQEINDIIDKIIQ